MRIISLNANGIRAAMRKGFYPWLSQQNADIVCIQETKVQKSQLDDTIFFPSGYQCFYADAVKKGYSGVALYTRQNPKQIITQLDWPEFNDEGRYLEIRFNNLAVVSIYLPSGSSSEIRQQAKFRYLDYLRPHLQALLQSGREYILCGDWNIAHRELDLKNWRNNRKNSGFLPEERAWLDAVFAEDGYIDAFRQLYPDKEQYTWWSNRGRARENNIGWRIDYQLITPGLKPYLQQASVYTDEFFSDHAPLIVDYAMPAPW